LPSLCSDFHWNLIRGSIRLHQLMKPLGLWLVVAGVYLAWDHAFLLHAQTASASFSGEQDAKDKFQLSGRVVDDNSLHSYTDADGLTRPGISASLAARDGSVWFGCYWGDSRGVSRFDHGRFTSVNTTDGILTNRIRCIKQATNGVIWFGTDAGLSAWNGRAWTNPVAPVDFPKTV
jgi:hypothetical protein